MGEIDKLAVNMPMIRFSFVELPLEDVTVQATLYKALVTSVSCTVTVSQRYQNDFAAGF